MKKKTIVIAVLFALAFTACNNFFHELIPPDGNSIESFYVDGQLSVEIGDNSITAYVYPGTDLASLLPSIRVSPGATLFPVTTEYVMRAFNDERVFGAAMQLYTSADRTVKVIELIRSNKDFTRPVLDEAINFDDPVDFLVVSGLGTIRQYTVKVEIDTGEGKFKSFDFDKFFNPEVVRTAPGIIDTDAQTVTVNVDYPVENIASYRLTPSFETNGARVYLEDGTEWRSGETLVDFLKPPNSADLNNPDYANQTKTLVLKRAGFPDATWTLTVNFREDPDTDRSIIDFRFTKALNPLISADAVAEISNSSGLGFIEITVYYSGEMPEELKANFISPGTVTVNDEMQISGYSMQDFSASTQGFYARVRYLVTSRAGGLTRDYYVRVTFVPGSDPTPQITYFSFRTTQNPSLVSPSTAIIDHNNRLILIEAAYDGETAPTNLIPEFSATGNVTVNGVYQISNTSAVNFSAPVKYLVSNPSNPTFKREYRVDVKFVRSLSSAAEITTFTFYKADNPGLLVDVNAEVNQATGAISAVVVFETHGEDRILVPRWTSQGIIKSGGITLTSGEDERRFYTPQEYNAQSADGVFKKNYTVTVREMNTRIYVKHDATGRNDGTNWENAYRSVNDAANYIISFPFIGRPIMREVWIAEGTYVTRWSYIYPNVSIIGGFRGNEASVSERVDPASRRPVISKDIEIEYDSAFSARSQDGDGGGEIRFVDIIFTRYNGGAVYVFELAEVFFSGVEFREIHGNWYGVVEAWYCNRITMTNCTFIDTAAEKLGGAVFFDGDRANISNCTFTNTYVSYPSRTEKDWEGRNVARGGGALYFQNCRATVTNCTFNNTRAANNRGHAILSEGNVTQSGNTFINVPEPRISSF